MGGGEGFCFGKGSSETQGRSLKGLLKALSRPKAQRKISLIPKANARTLDVQFVQDLFVCRMGLFRLVFAFFGLPGNILGL